MEKYFYQKKKTKEKKKKNHRKVKNGKFIVAACWKELLFKFLVKLVFLSKRNRTRNQVKIGLVRWYLMVKKIVDKGNVVLSNSFESGSKRTIVVKVGQVYRTFLNESMSLTC